MRGSQHEERDEDDADDRRHDRPGTPGGAAPVTVAHDEQGERGERPGGQLHRHRDPEADPRGDLAAALGEAQAEEADGEHGEVVPSAREEERARREREHRLAEAERAVGRRAREAEPGRQAQEGDERHPPPRVAKSSPEAGTDAGSPRTAMSGK